MARAKHVHPEQNVEKTLAALKLRIEGKSLPEIAAILGYANSSGVHKAIHKAIELTLQEPADEVRKIELERLDVLMHSMWQNALTGNPQVIDRILKIMERRAKLLGLDMPISSLNIDFATLTDNQLMRLAEGENVYSVLTSGGIAQGEGGTGTTST